MRVTVTRLEMRAADQLVPPTTPAPEPLLREVDTTAPVSREFYTTVGGDWAWVDRLDWPDEAWNAWIRERRVRTWIAEHAGRPVGYFQLAREDGDVEVAYLGLLPGTFGRGWGGWLLTRAVEAAWSSGVERVWLHTCSLDHPSALANYLARGFRILDQRDEDR